MLSRRPTFHSTPVSGPSRAAERQDGFCSGQNVCRLQKAVLEAGQGAVIPPLWSSPFHFVRQGSLLVRTRGTSRVNAPSSCGRQRNCLRPETTGADRARGAVHQRPSLWRRAMRRIETGAESLAQRQSTQGFSLAQARCKSRQNARARRLINGPISAASARLRDPTGAIPRAVQGRHGHGSHNAQVSAGDTREDLRASGHTAATASPTAV